MSSAPLIRIGNAPVYQNKMYPDRASALACPRGDVVLVQDPGTGIVHNAAYDPSLLVYDGSYQNEQAHSPSFKAHIEQVLAIVGRRFGGSAILEIGCGKGHFLERLRAAGHDALGVDPAYEGDADYILRRHFDAALGVRGDAIVMRHVLEHIPDPTAFLAAIAASNGGRGSVYIEVPCFDWIVARSAWFDVFYEHVNYFRLADFERLFGRVHEAGHLFGGQYIYVVADLATLRDPASAALPAPPRIEPPERFFASLDRCAAHGAPGRPRVVWGAAAKGVMFSHHMAARGKTPDLAVDINPAKQGRFLAGSGVPVLSPEAAAIRMAGGADVFVMNSNYLHEIRAAGGPEHTYLCVDQT
jgi:SAM-dependent methyltransferase